MNKYYAIVVSAFMLTTPMRADSFFELVKRAVVGGVTGSLVGLAVMKAFPDFFNTHQRRNNENKLDLSKLEAYVCVYLYTFDAEFKDSKDEPSALALLEAIEAYKAGDKRNEECLVACLKAIEPYDDGDDHLLECLKAIGLPITFRGTQYPIANQSSSKEDVDERQEKIDNMNEKAQKEVERQQERLKQMAPGSHEADAIRDYLDAILALPWGIYTEENLDIKRAKEILDADHYGLEKIKEHLLDYIAVRNLSQDGRSPILCLVGPPGVGKTSLGKSIARCLGRKYARISLGGLRDEAEIRGYRRTYIAAMPGKIMQAIREAGSCNPLIVLDEIDKVGSNSYMGDPSAALLEVLDPNQNKEFTDHYLGVPFDVSNVIFLATANSLASMSRPLRDRLEIIHLSGYIAEEKMDIAKQYLVPNALKDCGLCSEEIVLSDEVLQDIIINYTKEAGVRELDQVIRKLCAKAARHVVENDGVIHVTSKTIEIYLGPRKFLDEYSDNHDQVGITNGLCWTPYGGEVLKIEALLMPGEGKLLLTGQLGDVMQESARAALSYARAHAKEFGISENYFTDYDLHIHVPAGATPKDGPSAGITMLTSIVSVLTGRPISAEYAMTGELNLRGDVMPIGGLKEKILVAKRNKIPYVIIPYQNRRDLVDVENLVKGVVKIIPVKNAREVLDLVLLDHIKSPTHMAEATI